MSTDPTHMTLPRPDFELLDLDFTSSRPQRSLEVLSPQCSA
jgi:hypothetical protein